MKMDPILLAHLQQNVTQVHGNRPVVYANIHPGSCASCWPFI